MTELVSSAPMSRAVPGPRLRFYAAWGMVAVLLAAFPSIFTSASSLTTFSLVGTAIIFALSYNILLGQTGLLSFGHAVYYGIGAFFAVHTMNLIPQYGLPVPLPLVPLIGGVAGLLLAILTGWISTRRAGTVFSMISLGVAELAVALALILTDFFGGEDGISTNRTKLPAWFGWHFGPQVQVYYLVAFWVFISALAMYALTRTPLGKICNAVRDNPERVQFVGYDPHVVRYLAFCFAGLFAGIAGALAAISFESANFTDLGWVKSGAVIFSTYIGGTSIFAGPIVGAIFFVYLSLSLSDYTSVWQLYFGLLFILVVRYAPGGIGGTLLMHRMPLRVGGLGRILRTYAIAAVPTLMLVGGFVLAVETIVHHTVNANEDPRIKAFGVSFDASSPMTWIVAGLLMLIGYFVGRLTWRGVTRAWDDARTIASERGIPS
jgi:branched-chain amino acid transport system permease protein